VFTRNGQNTTTAATDTVTVSVVICSYALDRWRQLERAVHSALDLRPAPLEVIVVVDHCSELEDWVRADLAPMGVRILSNEGGPGLSGARNTGCAAALGDVVAFLDDDAEATPGWLAAQAAAAEPSTR
jgi:glycosyltransferase involved in cell wall biosynthesis